jgi:tetratricopeptide (TPR) repeat protein
LPARLAIFAGRSREIAALDEITAGPAPQLTIAVIDGVGGVGKTALAVHWLHAQAARYPDGALYADLAGHNLEDPSSPSDVLTAFLRALGTVPEQIPVSLAEQVKLFRSATSRRAMLVLLDNAASAAQVRALLPGEGTSLVLVTTRWKLAGLAMDGARFVGLGPLDEASAVGMVAAMTGHARIDVEPEAVRDIVRFCGGLPLAICVVGAQLAMHPRRPVSRMAAELASERDRLAALTIADEVSVRGAFDYSYRALPALAARGYRLLSQLFTPEFGVGLAAAHIGIGGDEAGRVLDVLTEASLLEEIADARFRFHDLVRLHARQYAEADPGDSREAVTRSVGWYLSEAVSAENAIAPGRWHLNTMYGDWPPRHAGAADALAWMESEMPGLVAAVHAANHNELHEQAWQLCEALWGLFSRRRYFRQWMDTYRVGLESAIACADKRAEARMRVWLGLAELALGRYDTAEEEFQLALGAARQAGHSMAEASALEHLGLLSLAKAEQESAIGFFGESLRIFRRIGWRRGTLGVTRRMGEAYRETGQHERAIDLLRQARDQSADLGDQILEGRALRSLGMAYMRAGQPGQAITALDDALEIATRTGGTYEQARIRASIADAALALGRIGEAREHLAACLDIYSRLGSPEADAVDRLLTELQLRGRTNAVHKSWAAMRLSSPGAGRAGSVGGRPRARHAGESRLSKGRGHRRQGRNGRSGRAGLRRATGRRARPPRPRSRGSEPASVRAAATGGS